MCIYICVCVFIHIYTHNPYHLSFFFFFCIFAISKAAPAAYGRSQAKHRIRAVVAGLCQSQSNTGSKPHLQPTPQLTATPDP